MVTRSAFAVALLLFLAFSAVCLVEEGLSGFGRAITYNLLSVQIFVDLVLAVLFWGAWVVRDARAHGRSGWGWGLLACATGSIALLLHAVVHGRWPGSPRPTDEGSKGARGIGAIALLAFAVLTVAAVVVDGLDVPSVIGRSWCSLQIWGDLVIAMVFWFGWVHADAKARGESPWGWIVYGLVLGSFAPLTYLAVHGRSPASHPVQ